MNNNISIVINARLQSTRLPNKMIIPFCGKTLIDIALEKINNMLLFDGRYLAVAEKELKDIGKKYEQIKIIDRNVKEVTKGIVCLEDRFRYFEKIPTDYIFLLNPCCPCVSKDTIINAVDHFRKTKYNSYTSVVETRDWIFTHDSIPITRKDVKNVATNKGEIFYKATHMFHILKKSVFLEKGYLWTLTKNDPHCVVVPEKEFVDIDNIADFEIAQFLYKKMYSL